MNEVLNLLENLHIKYDIVHHRAVYTVEEAESFKINLDGIGCKNLFLKDKNYYYLYILKEDKRADLKEISSKLNIKRLTFSSEEELWDKLKLKKGSVTPMGIINDDKSVILIIDKDLKDKNVLVHPNINTATICISYDNLIKYIEYFNNSYYEI